ncbi:hypothetical protein KAR91_49145 [Candidatus Pacearchaeota archaeon]|nr:hypothetical protein [Candidatus Pacearchaeota archaeon]
MASIVNWLRSKLQVKTNILGPRGSLRSGQSYDEEDVDGFIRRNEVFNFWANGIVEMAFASGYQILDKDEKPVLEKEIRKLNWLPEMKRATQKERGFASVTINIFDTDELMSFARKDSHFDIDNKGQFTSFELTEHIGGGHGDIKHTISGSAALENVKHVVLRPGEKKYEGISVIEPIFDVGRQRAELLESCAILVNRIAAGVRTVTIVDTGDKDENATEAATYKTGLKDISAGDDTIILFKSYDPITGNEMKDDIEIFTGTDFNFSEKLDMYHKSLSIATGVPKNYWDGIFQGETLGAPAVLRMLYAAMKLICDDWAFIYEQIHEQWAKNNNIKWSDEYRLVWNLKPKLTDAEEANIQMIKTTTVSTQLLNDLITQKTAQELLNLPIEEIEPKPLPTMPGDPDTPTDDDKDADEDNERDLDKEGDDSDGSQ